jgi:hypothetical protein
MMINAGKWLFALVCILVIMAVGLYVFPSVVPWSPNQLARAILLKGVLVPFVCFIAIAFLNFMDAVTGPSWYDQIGGNPIALAILASCMFLGIVVLAIYT